MRTRIGYMMSILILLSISACEEETEDINSPTGVWLGVEVKMIIDGVTTYPTTDTNYDGIFNDAFMYVSDTTLINYYHMQEEIRWSMSYKSNIVDETIILYNFNISDSTDSGLKFTFSDDTLIISDDTTYWSDGFAFVQKYVPWNDQIPHIMEL